MRLHRFYISEKIANQSEITVHSAELVNQVRRVFRLKKGDSLVLFDGSGSDYECTIDGFGEESKIDSDKVISLHSATSMRSAFIPARNIYLCAAVVKKDTFEWIVEKATELGVTHIIPIMAERSEKKSLNEARLKKIAIEASEQCGRGNIPVMSSIMTLNEAFSFLKKGSQSAEAGIPVSLAFHTEGSLLERSDLPTNSDIAVFIGPEGGWSETEMDMFHKNGIPVRCLGNQVLRAETAVIAALSQVVFTV